jgi:hypothetical protein
LKQRARGNAPAAGDPGLSAPEHAALAVEVAKARRVVTGEVG